MSAAPPRNLMRRIGEILLVTAFGLLLLAFAMPESAGLMAIIFAHVSLYIGFVLAVLGDFLAKRPFERMLLAYTVLMAFILAMLGPVIRAAGY